MTKCPICNKGELKKGRIKEIMFGVDLGEFPAIVCSMCKESFTDAKTTKQIEEAAKKKGIWGLRKRTKVAQVGNSLAIRIPKDIADFIGLKKEDEVVITPAGKKGISVMTQ